MQIVLTIVDTKTNVVLHSIIYGIKHNLKHLTTELKIKSYKSIFLNKLQMVKIVPKNTSSIGWAIQINK